MTTLKKTTWNTFKSASFTHDVANHPSSCGWMHHHQIRLTSQGWQTRIRQQNGIHVAYGETKTVSDEQGLSAFEKAKQY